MKDKLIYLPGIIVLLIIYILPYTEAGDIIFQNFETFETVRNITGALAAVQLIFLLVAFIRKRRLTTKTDLGNTHGSKIRWGMILVGTVKAIFIFLMIAEINYLGLSGFSSTKDVSSRSDLWGGYQYQKQYILENDVFLTFVDSGMADNRLALVPEEQFRGRRGLYSAPKSIDEYKADPITATTRGLGSYSYTIDVRGIVKEGTKLEIHKLERHRGFSTFSGYFVVLTPYAIILDGDFSGEVVDIKDISISYEDDGLYKYKPNSLLISENIPENY